MNVFELNSAIKTIQEKDIDPDLLKDTLESLEIPRNEKLDSVASWIEENNMKLDWLKNKKHQLAEVETSIKNQRDHLMDFLTKAIDDTGHKSIKTENHILKPRNYKASTVVENTKKLPTDYVIREEVVKPNKKLIYQDLKAGKEVMGAHLKPNRKTVIE
ncbi:MAG: hypothetical protein HDR41_04290 [Lactobacillus sp.]|nr:hypothetical protein [Lactobacillus sp.]